MAYATKAAKDKAIATGEANVTKLEASVEKLTKQLTGAKHGLAVAKADLEHRKSAPTVDSLSE